MPRDVPAHYIRGNAIARVPDRIVCLDTEASRDYHPGGETQEWSLGVASFTWWTSKGNIHQSQSRYDYPEDMWQHIVTFSRMKRRTVVYAHNIGYDLRISRALEILPALGWTLADARIEDRASWFKWQNQTRTLILCDSGSIFPTTLDQVGQMFGIVKPPLPQPTDRSALFARCEGDVAILTNAISTYIASLRTGWAGNWQVTGSGQSWSHFRHSHYTHKILVHDDKEAMEAERRAMWTGRCEAWKWGRDDHETVYEYDYSNAYPRIARDVSVPTRLRGSSGPVDFRSLLDMADRYAILAEVSVQVREPLVPTSHQDRIVWAVGRFDTVLWDPELRLLEQQGADVRVQRAWYYKREPTLKDWAEWILSQVHDKSGQVPEWQKLVLKHWSRTLIGRFAMRYRSWEQIALSDQMRLYVSDYKDMDTGQTSKLMQLGQQILLQGQESEGPDYCPQVTGYIMSAARARLWNAAMVAGGANVLYMDTDSLVVNSTGRSALEAGKGNPILDGLGIKQSSKGYRIYGPRAIILDRSKKVSGLPRRSQEIEPHKFTGETWESLKHALETGNHNAVSIHIRPFKLAPNPARRYLRRDGTTSPYELPTGNPLGGHDQEVSTESLALADGYPSILLGLSPTPLQDPQTIPTSSLRYSVRTG